MSDWTDAVLALGADSAWDCGQGSGTTYADLGAAAKDLTLTGGGYTQGGSTGLTGAPNGVNFTTGSYLLIASALTQVNTDQFTCLGLFYDNGDPGAFSKPWFCASYVGGHTDPYYTFGLFRDGGSSFRAVADTAGTFTPHDSMGAIPAPGAWHQMALVYNGSTLKVYLDGSEVGSTSVSGNVGDMGSFAINTIPALGGGFEGDNRCAGAAYFSDLALGPTDISNLWDIAQNGPSCTNPVNTVAPAVTGDACAGDTLTTDDGTWTSGTTIAYTYQWQVDCGTGFVDIFGETASTYVISSDYEGCDIRCDVTATNDCGPTSEPSNSVTVSFAPVNTVAPVISAVVYIGHQAVVTSDGIWDGTPTSYTYQWQIDCGSGYVDIVSETASSYTFVDGDDGCTFRCVVTAHNACGDTPANSNAVGPIQPNIPATAQFCVTPLWRFIVTTLQSDVLTFLDGLSRERVVTYTLNAPAIASGVVPSDSPEINIDHTDGDPFLAEGNRLLWGFRQETVTSGTTSTVEWVPRFAGMILQVEDVAASDNSDTHYTAFDPLQYLLSRPATTVAGTLPGANGLSFTATRVDVIIGTLISNAIVNSGSVHLDLGALYGGTGFWAGTIESLPQIDVNFPQGSSVGDCIKQLTDQNLVDITLVPVWDPKNRPGILCDMSIWAQAGAVQEDAIFAWDKPSRSLVGISRLQDGSERANNIKFFAGQAGTGTGGTTIPVQTDAVSEAKYGEYWAQQFWPMQNVASAVLSLASAQLELRKNGKKTVTINPIPSCTPLLFQEYFLGDRVPVYASKRFREALPTGAVQYQRIYGIPVQIADDSTEIIQQLLTSELTGGGA